MAVAVPVLKTGAFILNIDASRFLYPYIETFPTASPTGETVLARRDGDYLDYLRTCVSHPGAR